MKNLVIHSILLMIFVAAMPVMGQDISSGLMAHWKLDDDGSEATDSAGNYPGTISGTEYWTTGTYQGALEFDGTSNYVRISSPIALTGNYSISVWFQADPNLDTGDILAATDINGDHGILIEVTSAGTLRYLHRNPYGVSGGANAYSTNSYKDGQWHHLVAVSASSDDYHLYVDGERAGESESGQAQFESELSFNLGRINNLINQSSDRYFKGILDDIRIYHRALTADDVETLYLVKQLNIATVPDLAGYDVIIDPDSSFYTSDQEVSLTPVCPEGFVFDHWEDDLSGGTAPATITMDSNKSIVAYFTLPSDFGSGSVDDPYRISSAGQLMYISRHSELWAANTHFQLVRDIVFLPSQTTNPIGTESNPFNGVFDGQGFCIKGLTIDGDDNYYVGFFGRTGSSAKIINLRIESAHITGSGWYQGILVGTNAGTITNCHIGGGIVGYRWVGGLVGHNASGTITNCYSTAAVKGREFVGGLVGDNSGAIKQCYVKGSAAGSNRMGGLVGRNTSGSISNCYAIVAVTGKDNSYSVGGLVGLHEGNNSIAECYAIGNVSAGSNLYYIGGLVGRNSGPVSRCFANVNVYCDDMAESLGGLVGDNFYGTVSDCYATGAVAVTDRDTSKLGGLVGYNRFGSFSRCYSSGKVTRYGILWGDKLGGLAGQNDATISGCYWDITSSETTTGIDAGTTSWASGKTTEQMRREGTFSGWNFESVWSIAERESYPYLEFEAGVSEEIQGDVNGDGTVDIQDFVIMAGNWMKTTDNN